MRRIPAAIVLALVLGGCGGEGSFPCKEKDAACAFGALKKHRGKQASTWAGAFARPLEERIGAAPPFLVELVALDNIANGFPQRPRTSSPDAAFLEDVQRAVAEMPEAVRRPLARKLAGIYFIEDLGSTGFADQIRDASGRPAGAFIVLDPVVLRAHTANSWMSWRDGTPFKPDANYRLEGQLAAAGEDNRRGAIQYILLHEIAHVLAAGEKIHPDWELKPADLKSTNEYPFFELSWRVDKDRFVTPFDRQFVQRADIVYYLGPRIAADQMPATYEALEATNFPTLYAATSPGDDFAEAYANYVHTRMLGKPFEIRLLHQGEVARTYRACWDEPRCARKREYLEAFLGIR